MINSIERDKKKRIQYKKNEIKRKILNSLLKNENLAKITKKKLRETLSQLNRNSSITRIKNRCMFTGRGKGIYSKLKLSRITFKEMAAQKILFGIQKSSF
jgi:succinate dehydrogenase (ubiquinone) iron-sulfur subunit